jgi:hypothetical protein
VRVCGDDVLDAQFVLSQHFLNALNFISWVNDDGLAAGFVAHDGTVASQHAHGKNLVNHSQLPFLSPLAIVLDSTILCRH